MCAPFHLAHPSGTPCAGHAMGKAFSSPWQEVKIQPQQLNGPAGLKTSPKKTPTKHEVREAYRKVIPQESGQRSWSWLGDGAVVTGKQEDGMRDAVWVLVGF